MAENKIIGRMSQSSENRRLKSKVNYQYKKLNLEGITLKWARTCNFLFHPQRGRRNLQSLERVEEIDESSVANFMEDFLENPDPIKISKLDKIHNSIINTL